MMVSACDLAGACEEALKLEANKIAERDIRKTETAIWRADALREWLRRFFMKNLASCELGEVLAVANP